MSTTLQLSVDQYERMIARGAFDGLGKRVELISGELREMNPAGPVHDDYTDYLLNWSAPAIAAGQVRARCRMGVRIDDHMPEPDFVLLKPSRYGRRRPVAADVLLVVEVADSSLLYDLGEKARLYGQGNVVEYWVIDVDGTRLHRHLNPSTTGYERIDLFERSAKLSPTCTPDLTLDLQDLFLPS